jgi:hypothetical protein
MTVLIYVLLFLLPLLVSMPSSAAEYFFSPSGADENPGTSEQPWKTIAKANETLQPGDTAIFLNGHYPGVIEPMNSGCEETPITYGSENHLGAILTGGRSRDDHRVCVRLNQREYIVVEKFYLLPDRGGWMRLDSANHCIIRHCRMENATRIYSPIHCSDSNYNRYEDLQCWRSNNIGKYGHVSGDMWNNFNCSHNLFLRIHISRAGHRPFGLWFDCSYNVVRQCIFDCRWGRNFEFFSTPRLLVEECVITNGLDGSGSADGRAKLFIIDSIFRRNVIYRNYYGPLVINSYKYEREKPWGMINSRVYNNTWYRNHEYGYEMRDLDREPDPHMVRGNIFQNNIFANNDPGGDGLALFLVSNIAEDNRFRFNDLYGDKPCCRTVRYDWAWPGVDSWGGLAMSAIEANEKKPDQFIGNIDVDPMFADTAADDYRLQPGSLCIEAGQALAVTRASGSGIRMPVDDARWFYDGFGIPGEKGDLVFVGPEKKQARVVQADIENHILILDREVAWEKDESITLPYRGAKPDLGAYEHGAERELWYSAPEIPNGLRMLTMETATEPVVVTGFEHENIEEWHYYWNFSRQRNTDARMDDTTAASGKRSMRIFATGDEAIMSCDIRPRWWDIDRFPIIKLAYRIPQGVPLGLWIHAFKSSAVSRGAVCVGGSSARKTNPYRDLALYELLDDDQWHEVEIDARAIREVFPDVNLLQMFRFYTNKNGQEGQQYWFDNFRILPGENK